MGEPEGSGGAGEDGTWVVGAGVRMASKKAGGHFEHQAKDHEGRILGVFQKDHSGSW